MYTKVTFPKMYRKNTHSQSLPGLPLDFKTKPYLEFLRDQKLSPRLIAFILNAIALKTDRDLAETRMCRLWYSTYSWLFLGPYHFLQ